MRTISLPRCSTEGLSTDRATVFMQNNFSTQLLAPLRSLHVVCRAFSAFYNHDNRKKIEHIKLALEITPFLVFIG